MSERISASIARPVMPRADDEKPLPPGKDKLSRIISVVSLGVAIFSLYYTTLDERYRAYLALGQLRLNFSVGAKTIVRVDNQTLTFANGGNQAVSINRLGYLLNGVNEKPDGNLCSDDEPSAKAPAELPRLI